MIRRGAEPSYGSLLEDAGFVDGLVRLRARFTSPAMAVGFALLFVAIGFWVRLLLPDSGPRFVVLYPVVALSALVGGPISGIVATLTACSVAAIFLMEPIGSVEVTDLADRVSIANFVIAGLLISLISSLDRAIAGRVVRAARDKEKAEKRHRAMIEVLHEGVILFAPDGRVVAHNPSADRILGLPPGGLSNVPPGFAESGLVHEDGRWMEIDDLPVVRVLRSGSPIHDQTIGIRRGERVIWLLNNVDPMFDPTTGEIEGAVVSFIDISERRRVAEELSFSRARLATVFDTLQEGVMMFDAGGRTISCNRSAERILRLSAAEILGGEGFLAVGREVVREDGGDFPVEERPIRRALATGASAREVLAGIRTDEELFWIRLNVEPVRDPDTGRMEAVVASFTDVTERRRREVELAENRAHLASIFAAVHEGIVVFSPEGRLLSWNPAAERVLRVDAATLRGLESAFDERQLLREDGSAMPRAEYPAVRTLTRGESVHGVVVGAPVPGGPAWLMVNSEPIRDPMTGAVKAAVISLSDVTERKKQERHLAERDRELRQTLDAAGLGVWWVEIDTGLVHCDPRSRALFGASESEAIERLAERFHTDDRPLLLGLRDRIAAAPPGGVTVMRRSDDGEPKWLSLTARLRRKEGDGEEIWGTVQDITEARRAEETMRRAEASRRLEALGRMTGGIAHDLNNLLTVISGNLQLLEMSPGSADAGRRIFEALRASESGAALNRRLLPFARQRRLDATLADLDDLIGGMTDMLRRAVGPKVTIATLLASTPAAILIDRGEIENAVLNLVLNARDAMPGGGRVVVETAVTEVEKIDLPPEASAEPGAYVRLAVSDEGHGMTAEVKAQAFDPFFTTKKGDRGSGLGLATLHGFVHQSGGFVTLYSEVGRGTTVNLYLPVARGGGAASCERRTPHGNGETILLVEDDEGVRRVTRERLEALGYRVVCATDAEAAEAAIGDGGVFDIVLTDIVMPGERSGLDLARALRTADPARPILVASGLAGDLVDAALNADFEFPFLRKPYSLTDLAAAVDAALRSRRRPGG